jgi:hypothetical protein
MSISVNAIRRAPGAAPVLIVAALSVVLGLGTTGATAASKAHTGGSRTIGTCVIVGHPSATHSTQCVGMQLVNAPLRGADLSHADLTRADLSNANLEGTTLTGANLTAAVLTGAHLSGAQWGGTTCPDGTNSDDAGGSCSAHLSSTPLNLPSSSIGPAASLPKTGFDPLPFLASGSGLIAIGALLLAWARIPGRRRARFESC